MEMTKGKIIKVLDKATKIPKAQHRWNRNIEYCRDLIVA